MPCARMHLFQRKYSFPTLFRPILNAKREDRNYLWNHDFCAHLALRTADI